MGCGWSWPDTDGRHVDSIEVINGATATGPLTGLALWRARLSAGDRITAVAGSDPDAPAGQSPPGLPTTVVEADALSTAGILEGVRAGRVYIDVAGAGRQLELDAVAGGVAAAMGGTLPAGAPVRLSARGAGAVGATVRPRGDGGELAHRVLAGEMATFDLPAAAARRWIAATVERDGAPLLIGNAIYLSGKLTRRVPARR